MNEFLDKWHLGQPWMLLGALSSLLLGLMLLIGAYRARRARQRFGDDTRMGALVTHDPAKRRAFKGVFLVLATALVFVAAARPQYGKETILVPATKVDIVVALDFSKSMYARDVEPSRIFRARAEVGELVQSLPGVRFGAVAFSGDAINFPLTEDGAAIAEFFRGFEPNDMPVGGTSLVRALESARELLKRDPKAKEHKRFIILITDGEDLDGSPKSIARSLGDDGTTIHVVIIGGRTAERIPDIGPDGTMLGWRKTEDGEYMTTQLTPQGEKQLTDIAQATPGGRVVRAQKGRTGIEELTAELTSAMSKDGEYSEHTEEVWGDIYEWPLGFALLFLVLEAALTDAPRSRFLRRSPPKEATRQGGFRKGSARA
ncbi:MAG: vWA domain-containing protein [Polyangiaceae bacterium]